MHKINWLFVNLKKDYLELKIENEYSQFRESE